MSETTKAPLAGCATNLLHVEKLKEEQHRAYTKCCEQIEKWENFKADYDILLKRLETLPQKLSYDAMVPFGSVALMPGKIVHTNEITVLLGDNWFAERSAKQACDIVGRRLNQCDGMLKSLQAEEKQFKKWMGYTDMIKEETEQAVEIREEYDEATESVWKEQHKRNVQKYHQQLAKERSQMTNLTIEDDVFREKESSNPKLIIEEARLEEGPVFHRPSSSSWSGGGGSGDSDVVMPISKTRRVSWQDQSSVPRATTSEEEEDEIDEEDEDSSDEPEPLRINFTHCAYTNDSSSESSSSSSSSENESGSGSPTQTFQSPADLYVHFATLVQKPPKSILKKSSTPRGPDPETQPSPQMVHLGKSARSPTEPETVHSATVLPTTSAATAVSSQVIERAPTEAMLPSTSASRPSSRFKAQRQAAHR